MALPRSFFSMSCRLCQRRKCCGSSGFSVACGLLLLAVTSYLSAVAIPQGITIVHGDTRLAAVCPKNISAELQRMLPANMTIPINVGWMEYPPIYAMQSVAVCASTATFAVAGLLSLAASRRAAIARASAWVCSAAALVSVVAVGVSCTVCVYAFAALIYLFFVDADGIVGLILSQLFRPDLPTPSNSTVTCSSAANQTSTMSAACKCIVRTRRASRPPRGLSLGPFCTRVLAACATDDASLSRVNSNLSFPPQDAVASEASFALDISALTLAVLTAGAVVGCIAACGACHRFQAHRAAKPEAMLANLLLPEAEDEQGRNGRLMAPNAL